jgi:hypothetical protein
VSINREQSRILLEQHILATINLAHDFKSAFSREQVYTYLRVPSSLSHFNRHLNTLKVKGRVREFDGRLYAQDVREQFRDGRRWSHGLFSRYRSNLKMLTRIPWVKYIGLTGANAFESCQQHDDLDLFIVTQRKRLWIAYLTIVIISKLTRKRDILCVNYLVDEDNLSIARKTYFTGVQLVQMIPMYSPEVKQKLLEHNPWVYRELPNAGRAVHKRVEYSLGERKESRFQIVSGFGDLINNYIFSKYAKRLQQKYPSLIGNSLILTEGVAKLHSRDHHELYSDVASLEVEIEEATGVPTA